MKYNCNIIKDLLPSYTDGICSDDSKQIIEEHFRECESCKIISEHMKDTTLENSLSEEKNEILSKHNKHIKRKTYTIGIITSAILTIPVLVSLICNIAIGHSLDWFFIVLTSILLTASIIVVPLVCETHKLMWTVLCSTASLILLLLTCCIYSHGNWFFLASSASILGISVVFAPFILHSVKMNEKVSKYKWLIVYGLDSIWLYILLIVCGLSCNGNALYWQLALSISTYVIVGILLCILVIKCTKLNSFIKSGIIIWFMGLWIGFANNVINIFTPSTTINGLEHLDLSKGFSTWNTNIDNAIFNANIYFTIIVVCSLIGIVLIGIGLIKNKKHFS